MQHCKKGVVRDQKLPLLLLEYIHLHVEVEHLCSWYIRTTIKSSVLFGTGYITTYVFAMRHTVNYSQKRLFQPI